MNVWERADLEHEIFNDDQVRPLEDWDNDHADFMNEEQERIAKAAQEMWECCVRHQLTYPQAIHIMAATVKMVGQKCQPEDVERGQRDVAALLIMDLELLIPNLITDILCDVIEQSKPTG